MSTHAGSCHCGAVTFEVQLPNGLEKLRRCSCSLCRRKGAVVASVKLANLRITSGESALTLYQWGTRTAKHYFCSVCGIYTHHQRRSDPTEFGFNVACLDDVNVFALGPIPVLDGVNHPADRRAVAALEASSTPQLRRLGPDDAEACVTLRQEMLREAPHTFGASPEQDLASDVARVRERLADVSGDASFGMFAPDLVGFVGLRRERALKMAHKASLWGMYVRPSMRGQGLGQGLVQAAIGHASTLAGVSHLHLSVSEAAPLALALYEAHGFTRWGTEPAALLVGDSLFDEHHMVLSVAVRPGD